MKQMIQKLLILVVGLSVGINAFAYDFEVDGIYYDIISSTDVAVTSEKENSYSGNVVIPEQVTYGDNTYSVTSIGDFAFDQCSALTSVSIPDSVTFIGNYAFRDCDALTSVTIPDSVTSIGGGAFSGCSGLTSVTIPDSVTSIGENAFYNCESLTSLVIPDGVTSIGENAFYNCESLTSVMIPDGVTSIGYGTFSFCSALTSVTIPDSVILIGNHAFFDCSALTSVTIPNSVTLIDNTAFYRCTALTSVTIGDSVTSIGNSAFGSCSAMTRLESRAEVPPACGYYALDDINKQTCELFVPIKSLDAYKAAEQWKDFIFITGVDYDNPGSVGDAVSENGGVYVAANNDSIEITGADNAVKTVYNINGQVIFSGTDTTISVPENGIYIVRVAGQTFKVAL